MRNGDGFNTVAGPAVCKQILEAAEKERVRQKRDRSEVTCSVQAFLLTEIPDELERIVREDAAKQGANNSEERSVK